MTWQDQLRQLDQELAAGQISAEEYRRRRDELLAKAQRDQEAAQQQASADTGEGHHEGQQGPFPPPFRWEPSAPETTQVMQPVQDRQEEDTSAEATQVVPGEATGSEPTKDVDPSSQRTAEVDPSSQPTHRVDPTSEPTHRVDPASEPTHRVAPASEPTQRVDSASERTHRVNPATQQDPEATQVVRGPGTGPFPEQQFPGQQPFPPQQGFPPHQQFPGQPGFPGQQQMPQQTGWPQQQQQDAAPPWAGSDLPPLDGGASWIKQGPEVFDEGGGNQTVKIVGVVAAVVLLLAAAFGAYWLWGRGQTGGGQAGQGNQPPSVTAKPKEPTDIADVGGNKENHNDIKSFADIQARIPYLTPDEQQVYQSAGAGKVQFLVSHLRDGAAVVILTAQASDRQAAQTAAQNLGQLQNTYGMQQVPGAPSGVLANQAGGAGQPAKVRGHYAYQGAIIRIEVTATSASGPGLDVVSKDFSDVLNKQLRLSPANA